MAASSLLIDRIVVVFRWQIPDVSTHPGETDEWARTTAPWTAMMLRVFRSLLPLAAVTALLAISPGCGGDESELCQSLQDLQASVQSLGDIELDDTSAEELEQSANEILTDVEAVRDAGDEELGQELATFEATVQALVDDVEAASAEGELTRDSLAEIGASVGSSVTAFETLQVAAPDDCDLD